MSTRYTSGVENAVPSFQAKGSTHGRRGRTGPNGDGLKLCLLTVLTARRQDGLERSRARAVELRRHGTVPGGK